MPLILDRHTPSPGVPEFQRRFGWLLAVVGLAFVILIGRLWQLQVVHGEQYFQQTTNNFGKTRPIPAVRGLIKDRRGVVLVDNRPAYNVYVTPRYFTKQSRANLVKVLGLGKDEAQKIDDKLARAKDRDRYQSILVLDDIDKDRKALIDQIQSDLPGVEVQDVPHRDYLYGTLAAHILGYMNQVTTPELEAHKDEYEDGDYVGRYGIEKQWDNYLRGKKGKESYVVDAKGRRKSDKEAEDLIKGERMVDPVKGHNVILTIDVELQRIAERAMRNYPAGGVAVVDVNTGKILALVSKPAFDPNVMTGRLSAEEEAQMIADPYKPFLDKTLRQHYSPGSTFKFVTAIAGLEAGLVTPDDKVLCKGYFSVGHTNFRCTKDHGVMSLYDAIAQSCDVYFWQLGQTVGMDRMAKVATDFGLGAPSGLGLNGDVPGHVPWKAWYEKNGGFRVGYTINAAIGQGAVDVTVLQLALAYAALANGGSLWIPQIVERVETATGKVVADYQPKLRRRVQVSAASIAAVSKGMWGAVQDPKGTAYASRLSEIAVAGKTGTAQVRKFKRRSDKIERAFEDHAWFAGYAPAEEPKIAVVVLVEHGGHGGHVAAPVAMEIIRAYFEVIDPPASAAGSVVLDTRGVEDKGRSDIEPADEGAGIPTQSAPPLPPSMDPSPPLLEDRP